MSFGFIIVRYINSHEANLYWQEAYQCIRKLYPNKILVVDDNSPSEYITSFPVENCEIVASEYPKRGEILGYYYFHKLKPFDKAVIIHDTVFIQTHIKMELLGPCTYFWTFSPENYEDPDMVNIMSQFKKSDILLELYRNKNAWRGCFGVMSVIDWDFLNRIEENLDFFSIALKEMVDRETRMKMERIFSCVCNLFADSQPIPTLLGHIYGYCRWGRTFANYKRGENAHLPVIKVWTSR